MLPVLLHGQLERSREVSRELLREVDQRLANWLLSAARIRGTRTDKGLQFTVVLTNQQIAARIGSVREVVSRAFTRLQNTGLISVDGRAVLIPDEDALEIYAEGSH